jgi:hypothetical protein
MAPELQTVFISYASPDRARVTPYCDRLESRGISVWMDYKRVKSGQHWDFEIRRALDKAAIRMLLRTSPIRCLSDSIVTDGSEMIRCEGRRDFSMSMID